MPSLGTRTPGAKQEEQIFHANVAAEVEVCGTISLRRARPPSTEQEEQILHAHVAAVVEVGQARWRLGQQPRDRGLPIGESAQGINAAQLKGVFALRQAGDVKVLDVVNGARADDVAASDPSR